MRTVIDVVKKEVDAAVWCDSIEWRGSEVTFRKVLSEIIKTDITGSAVVNRWIQDLENVNPPRMKVRFTIKTYGCVRMDPRQATSVVKNRTHCFATFRVVMT